MPAETLTGGNDEYTLDRSTSGNTTGVFGRDGNDTLNLYASNDRAQIHSWGDDGDDQTNLRFGAENGGTIDRFAHGHHARGGSGNDVFNFQTLNRVDDIVVGRIEDFDPTRDTIAIDGTAILGVGPNDQQLAGTSGTVGGFSWRIVAYDADDRDGDAEPQQWLLIDTDPNNPGQSFVFYALDGARVTTNGASNNATPGEQEAHFIGAGGGHVVTAAELAALPTVSQYIDPINYVPADHTADGGNVINDTDGTLADESDPIEIDPMNGNSSPTNQGDLIAAGLNDDIVYAAGGNDHVWGGSGDDTIFGGTGDDTIHGGTGDDRLTGGAGANVFEFGTGYGDDVITDFDVNADTVTFNGTVVNPNSPQAGITLTQSGSNVILTHTGGESITFQGITLTGWESGHGTGSTGYNDVIGTSGDDRNGTQLTGTSGADRFVDGDGRDEMFGGAGADLFVLDLDGDKDEIIDFSSGEDMIDLSASGLSGFSDLTIIQDGASVKITYAGDILELKNTNVSDISANDFLF